MALTTLPKERNFIAQRRLRADVEILSLGSSATKYTGQYKYIRDIFVETVLHKTGKDPSIATLSIPIGLINPVSANPRSRLHKVYTIRSGNKLSPIAPAIQNAKSVQPYTKVRIYYNNTTTIGQGQRGQKWLMFVGYVSKMKVSQDQKKQSVMIIECKDARWLLGKVPVTGIIHQDKNVGFGSVALFDQVTFIKNATIPFNEGNEPNMFYDPFGKNEWWLKPKFIEPYFGRTNPVTNELIDDEAIENPSANDLSAKDFPVARHWLAGCVFNYIANLSNCSTPAQDKDLTGFNSGSADLWDDPSSVTQDDVPMSFKEEIWIPSLQPGADNVSSNTMGADWFRPRSLVGSQVLSGQQSIVSSVGVYAPFKGPSVIDVLQDLCYRMGNFTLAATYDEQGTGRLVLHVIRTTQADETADNSDVPVGLNSTERIEIVLPGEKTGTTFPDVHSFDMVVSADNFYNTFTTHGGRYWTQMTFLTMGTGKNVSEVNQFHEIYDPTSPDEFKPVVPYMTLQPSWTEEQQEEYVKLATAEQGQAELYPDVFTTFIISPEIIWPDMWGTVPNPPGGGNQALGLRRNFRRPRQVLPTLISSYFEKFKPANAGEPNESAGAWRSRRKRLPLMIWRSFKGVRTSTDGSTRFGDDTTESTPTQPGNGPDGMADWWLVQSVPQLLAGDGRTGIKFPPGARLPTSRFAFESTGAGTSGPSTSPLTWNGIIEPDPDQNKSARYYNIMMTVAVPSDEELFDYLNSQKTNPGSGTVIRNHGFRNERVQDAGIEYQQEQTINSVVFFPDKVKPGDPGTASNPFRLDPGNNSPRRIYTDGQKELTSRNHMMANKFAKPDIDGTLTFVGILPALKAGQYVGELFELQSTNQVKTLPINSLLSSVLHDFTDMQQTSVEFGTVR